MIKKIEVILIEDDVEVIHRSTSTVDEYANPYTVAINVIIDRLTGANISRSIVKAPIVHAPYVKPSKDVDKFAQAVPNYKPPIAGSSNGRTTDFESVNVGSSPTPASIEFHPDLIAQGVAKATPLSVEGIIPVVKLDMKSILAKGVK